MAKGNPVPLVNDWLDDSLKWKAFLPLQRDVKNFDIIEMHGATTTKKKKVKIFVLL
jgi:hypothetical protein